MRLPTLNTVFKHLLLKVSAAGLLFLVAALPAAAQPDTTDAAPDPAPQTDHSPRGALWRAAVLPGWGQYYNRQYLKIPIVYAGLGGLTAAALFTNARYLVFRHAYLYAEPRLPERTEYQSDYERARALLGLTGPGDTENEQARLAPHFKRIRNNMRRNRDLLYIGIGLFYGLTILDAYVNAHLLDFDVGEDLSLSFHPTHRGITASVLMDLR